MRSDVKYSGRHVAVETEDFVVTYEIAEIKQDYGHKPPYTYEYTLKLWKKETDAFGTSYKIPMELTDEKVVLQLLKLPKPTGEVFRAAGGKLV